MDSKPPKYMFQLDTPFSETEWYVFYSTSFLCLVRGNQPSKVKTLTTKPDAQAGNHTTESRDHSGIALQVSQTIDIGFRTRWQCNLLGTQTSCGMTTTHPSTTFTYQRCHSSVLSPIGQHRSNHVIPSKGKRDRKRKKQEIKEGAEKPMIPESPEIHAFVVVGLSSITRRLDSLSQKAKPGDNSNGKTDEKTAETPPRRFSAIFTTHQIPKSTFSAHLPQLIYTASLAQPDLPAIRLVKLPEGCDAQLCKALGLPRASFIGLLDGAPHADALLKLVLESIAEVKVPWLEQAGKGEYLPTKINAIETFAPFATKEKKGS